MTIIQENGKFYKTVESREEIDIEAIIKESEELKKKKTSYNNGNSGNGNSGNGNSGIGNSGNGNSGIGNSGSGNSGSWNSGSWNSGYGNSGYGNSGNWNSGSWNSGYGNSGYFSSITPNASFFGKESKIKIGDYFFPSFFYFKLSIWIYADRMSDEEKKEFPTYKTTGGYLKKIDYKTAWRNAWNKAEISERKKVLELPNYDNKIFLEITGIDAKEELSSK